MKVILMSRRHARSRSIELGRWSRALLSMCCLGLPLGLVAVGYHLGVDTNQRQMQDASLESMHEELKQQSSDLAQLKQHARQKLQALTLSMAQLRARLVRLDALGEQLTSLGELNNGEFDFSQPPALGGPLSVGGQYALDSLFAEDDLQAQMSMFASRLSDSEQQLEVLQDLLAQRRLNEQSIPSGRPVEWGWVSSPFGWRTDPFTGKPAMHHGIDYAGKEGSNILAVASGVVTSVAVRTGYGQTVELTHADGYLTRYAHNKDILVEPGDVVSKGQAIALMGSTGRSTGPHVHFEVYKHGRAVDPASYVRRNLR